MPGRFALDRAQLATLVAVLRAGSFDRAAGILHVTPSAVSQRIKQLEEHVGGVVVIRGAQTRPTSLGEVLYRHGLQIELLERELESSVGGEPAREAGSAPAVQIAVNADSLATWITPALAAFTRGTGTAIEVFVDDQDHTTSWLRSGRVLGAITRERLAILRAAESILDQEIRAAGLYREIWQSLAVLLPIRTVGVMGDQRTYEHVIALRAVTSMDGMTADWAKIPNDVLGRMSNRIINEVKGVNRVVYDISSKPPATIEWE